MNKRFILFLLVSAVILFGWAILFPRKQPETEAPPVEDTADASEVSYDEELAPEEERAEPDADEPAERYLPYPLRSGRLLRELNLAFRPPFMKRITATAG
jgi:hypothetical protein